MTDGLENVFLNKLTGAIEEEGRHAIGKRKKRGGGGDLRRRPEKGEEKKR